MGCTSSKIDDLPAVVLCRERLMFLDDAVHNRYALAEAHMAYMQSLKGIGVSLHNFFEQDFDSSFLNAPASPILPLPREKKGGDAKIEDSSEPSALPKNSHSDSGSHLHFHSDSDVDEGSSGSLGHSDHMSPCRDYSRPGPEYMNQETLNAFSGGYMHMNYMKKQPTPSASYQQRPMSPEVVRFGESSSYYPPPYGGSTSASYPYYGGMSSYFGSMPPPYGVGSGASLPPQAPSTSKPPPPPPSPPRASAWDFLNPFDAYDKYYSAYTPSRDSKELREEEGIPELEDENYQQEVVKEIHGDQKFVDTSAGAADDPEDFSKAATVENDDEKGNDREAMYQARPSGPEQSEGAEYEVHVVEKKVVDGEPKSEERSGFKGSMGVSEIVKEIQVQFERASESGNELAVILEVGTLPYHRRYSSYPVSSKMFHAITPSLPVLSSLPSTSYSGPSSSSDKTGFDLIHFDEEAALRIKKLSSTLQKLYLWEKKLCREVKAEEKMRLIHDRKCKKLKHLDEKGAEASKVDSTRVSVRSLSTKIRIAIQVVDKISVTINKIRDEELWPQLNDLIQGLTRMWRSMLECHHNQCQAIRQARGLDAIASHKRADSDIDPKVQLQHDLINWALSLTTWVGAQKDYVRALNNWLLKCLLYEPEETPDGPVPFSPGRIGAPLVFVICNQWSHALEGISEKEAIHSMRIFSTRVLELWERDKLRLREDVAGNERKVRDMDREGQKMQREIQALEKKMVMFSGEGGEGLSLGGGQAVYQSETSSVGDLHASLQHVFEAMERFAGNSTRAYEELLRRLEEESKSL